MIEITGEPGTGQQFVERTIAVATSSIEAVVELSPERCMLFTPNRQVLVKANYLETIGELNSNG